MKQYVKNTVCHKVVRLCAQGEEAPVFFNVHVYRPVMPCEEKLIPVVIPAADTLPEEIISMAAEQGFEICSFEIAEAAPDDKEKNLGGRMCKSVSRIHMACTCNVGMAAKPCYRLA